MADASDTMRYLVKQVDIAPAGTREEGEAAKNLSVVFHKHGLETANKSFKFSPFAKTAVALLAGIDGNRRHPFGRGVGRVLRDHVRHRLGCDGAVLFRALRHPYRLAHSRGGLEPKHRGPSSGRKHGERSEGPPCGGYRSLRHSPCRPSVDPAAGPRKAVPAHPCGWLYGRRRGGYAPAAAPVALGGPQRGLGRGDRLLDPAAAVGRQCRDPSLCDALYCGG